VYHIALRKNGRTVKKMGPYDSCEAATHDGHALLAAGTVPPGVQVHVIEGAMRKPASKARAAVRRSSPSSMVRGQSGMRQRRNPMGYGAGDTRYTFDGTTVVVSDDGATRTVEFTDTRGEPPLSFTFSGQARRNSQAALAGALPGYLRAKSISPWWADRVQFVYAKAINIKRSPAKANPRRNPKYAVGTRVRYQPVIGAAVEATVVAPFSVGYPTARMVPIEWSTKAGKRSQTWVSAAEIKPLTKANPRRRNPHGEGPYTHFVVQESSGRVVDGAWLASDARDTVKEHKENGVTGLKVLSRATMKQRGYSVDNRHFKPPVR
jgi:hypothetical protein